MSRLASHHRHGQDVGGHGSVDGGVGAGERCHVGGLGWGESPERAGEGGVDEGGCRFYFRFVDSVGVLEVFLPLAFGG